jgi:hypothetical protein
MQAQKGDLSAWAEAAKVGDLMAEVSPFKHQARAHVLYDSHECRKMRLFVFILCMLCMHVCLYVCVCICVCIHIIYIYIYIHTCGITSSSFLDINRGHAYTHTHTYMYVHTGTYGARNVALHSHPHMHVHTGMDGPRSVAQVRWQALHSRRGQDSLVTSKYGARRPAVRHNRCRGPQGWQHVASASCVQRTRWDAQVCVCVFLSETTLCFMYTYVVFVRAYLGIMCAYGTCHLRAHAHVNAFPRMIVFRCCMYVCGSVRMCSSADNRGEHVYVVFSQFITSSYQFLPAKQFWPERPNYWYIPYASHSEPWLNQNANPAAH